MDTENFVIKSLYIQNTVMLGFLGIATSFLLHSIVSKRPKRILVFFVWFFIVLWFFNSPFFGFSAVSVSPEGIKLNYGILSFRNDLLPVDSHWKVVTHMSGVRKNKRLYFISIADRQSMKVKGQEKLRLLQDIGSSIDRLKIGLQRKRSIRNQALNA